MSDVFISYSKDARTFAEELSAVLEQKGWSTWTDLKLLPGQRWFDELEAALNNARYYLILIGPSSHEKPVGERQEREWQSAAVSAWKNSDRKLIPIIFGQLEPPPLLREWVPLRIDPSAESSTWTSKVLSALTWSSKSGSSMT